jgi:plasmid replication initiation protein
MTYTDTDNKKYKGLIRAKTDFLRTSRHSLSLLETRVIYYALLCGQQAGRPFTPVTLSVMELKNIVGLKGNSSYNYIKHLGGKILDKRLAVEYDDDKGKKRYKEMVWVKTFAYNEGDGTIIISPNEDLAEYFLGIPYLEVKFLYIIRFRCRYTERLYELLTSFKYKDIAIFGLQDLKKKFGLEEGAYDSIKDFKARVLVPAVDDINRVTDMMVSFEEIKGYRKKTTEIAFRIGLKAEPASLDESMEDELEKIYWVRSDKEEETETGLDRADREGNGTIRINENGTIPDEYFNDEEKMETAIYTLVNRLAHGGDDLYNQVLYELIIMCGSSYNETLQQKEITGRMVFDQINTILAKKKTSLEKIIENASRSYKAAALQKKIQNTPKYIRACIYGDLYPSQGKSLPPGSCLLLHMEARG